MPKKQMPTTSSCCTDVDRLLDEAAHLATSALMREVMLTPKPGLVDMYTNGAHTDMNVSTFLRSIQALESHFKAYIRLGFAYANADNLEDRNFISQLRAIGRVAETDMFRATGGINTHKGANYSFSLILAATGIELAAGTTLPFDSSESERILICTSKLGQEILNEDFGGLKLYQSSSEDLSHGEQLFLEKGVTGIRGESAAGYPLVANVLLPYLRKSSHNDSEDTLLHAMVLLMATLEDTNLLHRGGLEGLAWVKEQAQQLWKKNPPHDDLIWILSRLDRAFTERNLSPGGTADLLSLGIYFASLENVIH